ncbi:unnamed protein product [Linum trigynum]|uniref:SWIM-type domain-containing protein n=1 Tax=Linum trigynum TaxID=586398 RepID=A0AAV2FBV0_9ROSI
MMDSAPITMDEVVDAANEQKTGETGTETAMDVDIQETTVQREIDDEIKIIPSNEETWMNLRFDTKDHGLLWYKCYAHDKGFSVRETGGVKRTSNNKPCEVVRYFGGRCNKEGWRKGSTNNPANDDQQPRSRIRKEDRWDCKAVIRFQLEDSSQKYYISSWLDEHNHKMIPPSSRQFMRSNRTMNEVQKFLIDMYHKAGISIQSSFQALCLAAGGRENVGFTQMDHKNYIGTKRQKTMKFGEATMIYHHFKSEASMDPAFFYEIQVDINEEIASIFWADGCMRMDYFYFGDTISFDTTYRTNKNARPLALFVGFNNYRETCVFGAALLYDETSATFDWLFKQFLICMNGKEPGAVFTDQAAAIAAGIRTALPHTYHGLCTFHITMNAKSNGLWWSPFLEELSFLMYDLETEDEFDYYWKKMLENCFNEEEEEEGKKLTSKIEAWLQNLHKVRSKWSSAWLKDHFACGMRSSQLSESCNSHLRKYLQSKLTLWEFFIQFNNLLEAKRHKELRSDYEALNTIPYLVFTNSEVLQQFVTKYTQNIFGNMQDEYSKSIKYHIRPNNSKDIDGMFAYELHKLDQQRNPIDKRIVMVDFVERKLICSCKMFEKCGWLCRHVLRAIDHLGYGGHPEILNIHTRYILKRWTYDAKSGDFTLPAVQDTAERVYCSRVKQLTGSMNLLATRTCMDDDIYKMLEEGMQALKIRDESMMPAMKFGQPSTSTEAELNPASSESEPHWAKALKVRTDPFKSRTRRKNRIEIIRERRRQTKLQERAAEGK